MEIQVPFDWLEWLEGLIPFLVAFFIVFYFGPWRRDKAQGAGFRFRLKGRKKLTKVRWLFGGTFLLIGLISLAVGPIARLQGEIPKESPQETKNLTAPAVVKPKVHPNENPDRYLVHYLRLLADPESKAKQNFSILGYGWTEGGRGDLWPKPVQPGIIPLPHWLGFRFENSLIKMHYSGRFLESSEKDLPYCDLQGEGRWAARCYLIPFAADAPKEKETVEFDGKKWHVFEDHQGRKIYSQIMEEQPQIKVAYYDLWIFEPVYPSDHIQEIPFSLWKNRYFGRIQRGLNAKGVYQRIQWVGERGLLSRETVLIFGSLTVGVIILFVETSLYWVILLWLLLFHPLSLLSLEYLDWNRSHGASRSTAQESLPVRHFSRLLEHRVFAERNAEFFFQIAKEDSDRERRIAALVALNSNLAQDLSGEKKAEIRAALHQDPDPEIQFLANQLSGR